MVADKQKKPLVFGRVGPSGKGGSILPSYLAPSLSEKKKKELGLGVKKGCSFWLANFVDRNGRPIMNSKMCCLNPAARGVGFDRLV